MSNREENLNKINDEYGSWNQPPQGYPQQPNWNLPPQMKNQ